MPRESKVELYAAIRRDSRAGLSIREIARKHRVGNHTIAAALKSAWPAPRKPYPKRSSKLDPFKPAIDVMLRSDLDAPKKQRHTVTRIYARLIDEHAMSGIAYQTVREYVAERKPEIWVEAGRGPAKVFIPQTHRPGEEAEVDFGEVAIRLRGESVTINLFALRMSFSGKGVHRAFASGGFEAFFEGHVHAFNVLGGVPRGKVRYDNLKAAVSRVLGFARYRQEADRWTAFRSHYDLEPFYCQPGIEGAHEKGGVEGDVGWFRRNHMVPVPEVDSLDELNLLIDEWDLADDNRRIGARPHTVGEHFAVEKPLLKPLPEDRFETGRWFHPRVDRYSHLLTELTLMFRHVSAVSVGGRSYGRSRVRRLGRGAGSCGVGGSGGGVAASDRLEVGAVSVARPGGAGRLGQSQRSSVICWLLGGARQLSARTGWTCCAGSGSCGRSELRGTGRPGRKLAISAGGSRSLTVRGVLAVRHDRRGRRTRCRCGCIARLCCGASTTFTATSVRGL